VTGNGAVTAGTASRPMTRGRIGLLTQLGRLHRQGVLTDVEFAEQKVQLLTE